MRAFLIGPEQEDEMLARGARRAARVGVATRAGGAAAAGAIPTAGGRAAIRMAGVGALTVICLRVPQGAGKPVGRQHHAGLENLGDRRPGRALSPPTAGPRDCVSSDRVPVEQSAQPVFPSVLRHDRLAFSAAGGRCGRESRTAFPIPPRVGLPLARALCRRRPEDLIGDHTPESTEFAKQNATSLAAQICFRPAAVHRKS